MTSLKQSFALIRTSKFQTRLIIIVLEYALKKQKLKHLWDIICITDCTYKWLHNHNFELSLKLRLVYVAHTYVHLVYFCMYTLHNAYHHITLIYIHALIRWGENMNLTLNCVRSGIITYSPRMLVYNCVGIFTQQMVYLDLSRY